MNIFERFPRCNLGSADCQNTANKLASTHRHSMTGKYRITRTVANGLSTYSKESWLTVIFIDTYHTISLINSRSLLKIILLERVDQTKWDISSRGKLPVYGKLLTEPISSGDARYHASFTSKPICGHAQLTGGKNAV